MVLLSAALSSSLLVGCRSIEFAVANAPTPFVRLERHSDIPYAEADRRQRLDIYAPPGAKSRPVVIFWYGGSWVMGSKSEYRFVGTTLAQQGFVVVIPDYRLYPQVTFPVFDADAALALAWVEQHVAAFGGDPRRIVLMGHSAGAHTAAFLALNQKFVRAFGADPRGVIGLIGLSGPYALMPNTPELWAIFPEPYSPRDWQPLAFVTPEAPATLLLHGAADKEVSPEQAIKLRDALARLAVPVTLKLYAGRGHGSTVAAFSLAARWNTRAVRDTAEFLNRITENPH